MCATFDSRGRRDPEPAALVASPLRLIGWHVFVCICYPKLDDVCVFDSVLFGRYCWSGDAIGNLGSSFTFGARRNTRHDDKFDECECDYWPAIDVDVVLLFYA